MQVGNAHVNSDGFAAKAAKLQMRALLRAAASTENRRAENCREDTLTHWGINVCEVANLDIKNDRFLHQNRRNLRI